MTKHKQFSDQLRNQIRGQIYGQIRGKLHDKLGGRPSDMLYGQPNNQLYGHHLYYHLWSQIHDKLRNHLAENIDYDET